MAFFSKLKIFKNIHLQPTKFVSSTCFKHLKWKLHKGLIVLTSSQTKWHAFKVAAGWFNPPPAFLGLSTQRVRQFPFGLPGWMRQLTFFLHISTYFDCSWLVKICNIVLFKQVYFCIDSMIWTHLLNHTMLSQMSGSCF